MLMGLAALNVLWNNLLVMTSTSPTTETEGKEDVLYAVAGKSLI